jgi:hypothetical protein
MTRILIIPQRDLLGQIVEYLVTLEQDCNRWPLQQCEWLTQAQRAARDAMKTHSARRMTIEVGQ